MSGDNSVPANQQISQGVQLALDLFARLEPQDRSVAEAPKDLGFNRSDALIEISGVGLAARRALDVAYFLVAQAPQPQKSYEIELAAFKWLMDYRSNNHGHLKKVLSEAQKSVLQIQAYDGTDPTKDRWLSLQLLGTVGVGKGQVYFEVHPELQRQIQAPASFHFLSLCYVFRSVFARILFDRLLPYTAATAAHITPWLTVDTVRAWFDAKGKMYEEYKYLRRNVLDVAVSQIKEVTGYEVSIQTKNVPGSKRVGTLRFQIAGEPTTSSTSALLLAHQTYESLKNEFGLSGAQFDEVLRNRKLWDDERIQQAMEYTRVKLKQGLIKQSVSGYFMASLREGCVVGTLDLALIQSKEEARAANEEKAKNLRRLAASSTQEVALKAAQQADEGWTFYLGLTPGQQKEVLNAYMHSAPAKMVAKRLNVEPSQIPLLVDENKMVRQSFGVFLDGKGRQLVAQ